MNSRVDELTKNVAQSVTRRGALKKFGVGLAGMALACFGLATKAKAAPNPGSKYQKCVTQCLRQRPTWTVYMCEDYCRGGIEPGGP
jgi:hypothetical protein